VLRPRDFPGLFRDRLPVSLSLYLAGLDGRLVWQGENAFALLDFPLAVRDFAPRQRARQRWLNRLDANWSAAVLGGPAAALLLVAAALAVLGAAVPMAQLGALVAIALSLLWVASLQVGALVSWLIGVWRSVERTPDPRTHATSGLRSEHWTIALCHAGSEPDALALLAGARSVADLRTPQLPGATQPDGRSPLVLCLLDGVTSETAEDAIVGHPDAIALDGSRPRMAAIGDRVFWTPEQPPVYSARGIFLLLAAVAITLLVSPTVLISQGYSGCAGSTCGFGTSYLSGLRWLAAELIPGVDAAPPAGVGARIHVFGYLFSVLGWVVLVAVGVAIARHTRFQRSGRDQVYAQLGRVRDLRQPTFGVVATSPEAAAAIQSLLGGLVQPVDDDRRHYTLGELPSKTRERPHAVAVSTIADAGSSRAAAAAADLIRTFPTVGCILLVGVGGGVPRPREPLRHVRLGDVVVSSWGLVDFDHVDQRVDGPVLRNGTPVPSELLKASVTALRTEQELGRRPWEAWTARVGERLEGYRRPDPATDVVRDWRGRRLAHPDPVLSGHRVGVPKVHHGVIGTSDRSLRDARVRDELAAAHELLAFEMEAEGVGTASSLAGREWLVVLGIGNYADQYADDETWRRYAAAAAAGYVAALLTETSPQAPAG
jgi:nucleoside phosphorylase